jgi:hypothetical protein
MAKTSLKCQIGGHRSRQAPFSSAECPVDPHYHLAICVALRDLTSQPGSPSPSPSITAAELQKIRLSDVTQRVGILSEEVQELSRMKRPASSLLTARPRLVDGEDGQFGTVGRIRASDLKLVRYPSAGITLERMGNAVARAGC